MCLKTAEIQISWPFYWHMNNEHQLQYCRWSDELHFFSRFIFYRARRSAQNRSDLLRTATNIPSNYLIQSALIDIRFSEKRNEFFFIAHSAWDSWFGYRIKIIFDFSHRQKMLLLASITIYVCWFPVIWFSFFRFDLLPGFFYTSLDAMILTKRKTTKNSKRSMRERKKVMRRRSLNN